MMNRFQVLWKTITAILAGKAFVIIDQGNKAQVYNGRKLSASRLHFLLTQYQIRKEQTI